MSDSTATGGTVDPQPIVSAATGFMAAKQLFAASDLGVFAALADRSLSAGELAEQIGVPERSARIVADAMVGLGLVTYVDGRYQNTQTALTYLAGRPGGVDLRGFLRFWDELSYPHWLAYNTSIRTAQPAKFDMAANGEVFFAGVSGYNALHGAMLAAHYDFTAHRRVLDLAGLSTSFLTGAIDQNPELRGVFAGDKGLIDWAVSGLDASYRDKIEFVPTDVLTDAVPTGFDAVLLEHVIHRYDAAQNQQILTKARGAVDDGGTLLLVDFVLEPEGERGLDALLAGEYLVIDGTVVYPQDEVIAWLEATGWRLRESRLLPGSPRVLIADAV
jgi:hypothetical protein